MRFWKSWTRRSTSAASASSNTLSTGQATKALKKKPHGYQLQSWDTLRRLFPTSTRCTQRSPDLTPDSFSLIYLRLFPFPVLQPLSRRKKTIIFSIYCIVIWLSTSFSPSRPDPSDSNSTVHLHLSKLRSSSSSELVLQEPKDSESTLDSSQWPSASS